MILVAILWGLVQKDVSNQIQSILYGVYTSPTRIVERGYFGFYAQLEGLSRNNSQPNDMALASGQD